MQVTVLEEQSRPVSIPTRWNDLANLPLTSSAASFYSHYVCLREQKLTLSVLSSSDRSYGRRPGAGFDIDGDEVHYPTRPVDKDKAEQELIVNIKKATSTDETAPKQKHVRSTCAIPKSQCILP